MVITARMLWLVCPLCLLAGFIDAVAGGGGLISLPAYYLAGLPASLAAGTNKLSAAMGTTLATINYSRSGKINMRIGAPAAFGALLCSALGALIMARLPDKTVRVLVMCFIPIAAFFTLRGNKSVKTEAIAPRAALWLSLLIGCAIGFYDGFIGPGTGTFLILLFTHIFGMESVEASGTAKLVNLSSNVAALVSLIAMGDVLYPLGLAAGGCAMIGGFLGSKLAIRRGARFIRVAMCCVLALMLIKTLMDMFE